ncbi:MAG: lipocalin-like domain-containing protein [Chloroflexota bacterium]
MTQAIRNKFVGSWRLISSTFQQEGKIIYPLGEAAQGRLMYDAQGNMAAQLMQPERERLSGKDETAVILQKTKAAFDGYTAYYGTFDVDTERGVVIHHVHASMLPNWVGRDLERFYDFSDNDRCLSLTTPPMGSQERPIVGTLVWERI